MIRRCKVCKKYYSVSDPLDISFTCGPECLEKYKQGVHLRRKKDPKEADKSQVAICKFCGQEYVRQNKNTKYCSTKCRNEASKERKKQYNASRPHTSDLPKQPIKCKQCGKEFIPERAQIRYCSDECKKAHKKEYSRYYKTVRFKKALSELPEDVQAGVKSIQAQHNELKEEKVKMLKTRKMSETLAAEIEMAEWMASRRARKKWEKVPLEEADAICKKYNLTYPQYQYMKSEGKLDDYIRKYKREHKGE